MQPTIGFYFGTDPPERTPAMLRLGRQNIDIPPGDKDYIGHRFVRDCRWTSRCRPCSRTRTIARQEMVGFATLPDGTVRPLIHISDWDFRWQHVYRYATPFWLPKGTTARDALHLRQLRGQPAQSGRSRRSARLLGAAFGATRWAICGSRC